ncbi:hypothetical protein T12_11885 [Trichinella patagoniensis]|uniref:KRAB-A domain-containing protein 2 n=1 Tax=Trichinella patagoniensis TaxID=990121 RepID=A0A0V0Z8M8_9BILA|nr:hypothetical protein T12_11885 [Trichinella patagoniensis]
MEKIVQSICKDVANAINDDSALVGKLFGKIEQISGRSRYQAAILLAGVICMLLAIYNPAVKLLCDLICIVYPVMKTLAEMESIEKSRCKQWMFYWVIFVLMDRKAVFEEKFRTLIKEKGQNAQIFPTSQRDQMITDISRIQSDGPKSVRDYNSRNQSQNKWANVTREACHMFATLCEECHKKRARKLPKSLVVKPPKWHQAARNLHNLFWLFCNPTTVKCHNAPSSAIIGELKTCWPELKLVTGRSRHPQSQGAIERLNGVVQKKLAIRMQEKNTKIWSIGLKFVQWQIYLMQTEEEVEGFLAFQEEANEKESLNRDEKSYKENESIAEKTFLHRDQAFIKAQEEAAEMKRRFTKMLKPLHIGQIATVRVPDVDRGPADPKNFLVLIMAECERLYTVGCREGKLSFKFTAADLQVTSKNLISIDEYIPFWIT